MFVHVLPRMLGMCGCFIAVSVHEANKSPSKDIHSFNGLKFISILFILYTTQNNGLCVLETDHPSGTQNE